MLMSCSEPSNSGAKRGPVAFDRELANPIDPGRGAARHIRGLLELVNTIEFRFAGRMKLGFHLATRRHPAGELELNFQHAAVVGLGLPNLVDNRLALGIGVRSPVDCELRGAEHTIRPGNRRLVDEPIEHDANGLARRGLLGRNIHCKRRAKWQGFAFPILHQEIIDQGDAEIRAFVGAGGRRVQSKPAGRNFCTVASGALKARAVRTLRSFTDNFSLSCAAAGEIASTRAATNRRRMIFLP